MVILYHGTNLYNDEYCWWVRPRGLAPCVPVLLLPAAILYHGTDLYNDEYCWWVRPRGLAPCVPVLLLPAVFMAWWHHPTPQGGVWRQRAS